MEKRPQNQNFKIIYWFEERRWNPPTHRTVAVTSDPLPERRTLEPEPRCDSFNWSQPQGDVTPEHDLALAASPLWVRAKFFSFFSSFIISFFSFDIFWRMHWEIFHLVDFIIIQIRTPVKHFQNLLQSAALDCYSDFPKIFFQDWNSFNETFKLSASAVPQ